jgi:hypothetical protein
MNVANFMFALICLSSGLSLLSSALTNQTRKERVFMGYFALFTCSMLLIFGT